MLLQLETSERVWKRSFEARKTQFSCEIIFFFIKEKRAKKGGLNKSTKAKVSPCRSWATICGRRLSSSGDGGGLILERTG